MYNVTVDPARKLVVMAVAGFIRAEETAAHAADLHRAIRSLGADAGQHVTLYDLRAMKVAPGDTVDRFLTYFTEPQYAPIWARKVAFVTTSALVTLQMRRIAQVRPNMAVFADRETAIAWLLED